MKIILFFLTIFFLQSCSKKKFLEAKPNSDIVVPTTLDEMQALLEYDNVMSETPVLGEVSSDNYYLNYTFWEGLNSTEKNSYTWQKEIYNGEGSIGDWNLPYQQIFYANVVLEGLAKLDKNNNEQQWNKIKGSALFIRAYAFYNLAQIFSPAFGDNSANGNLGLPLRTTANINDIYKRATVKQTYDLILDDLTKAASLLPTNIEKNRNRPNKPAAFAMLARVYLSMRDYENARLYADSCLGLYNALIDYNSLSKLSPLPFQPDNAETLYQSKLLSTNIVLRAYNRNSIIDSTLFNSYSTNDLRADSIFYTINSSGYPNIKGSYNGSVFLFSGLATDEVYLIRAECQAKSGFTTEALNDLNTLLIKRWDTGTYVPYIASSAEEARTIILNERRKELAFRGLRWTDIRRLNIEGANISLKRILNQEYHLPYNNNRFILPIPPDVIALSGIEQNPRE